MDSGNEGFKGGIAIDYQGIEVSRKFEEKGNEIKEEASIDNLPFPDEAFDLAYAKNILDDLYCYRAGIHEIIRVAQKEAIIVFSKLLVEEEEFYLAREQSSSLYAQRYSKQHLEEFLHAHPRVASLNWEFLDNEWLLRILLLPKEEIKEKIKPFVIIVEHSDSGGHHLSSIFQQGYPYWRLICLDKPVENIEELIEKHGYKKRTHFVGNEKNKDDLASLYHTIHSCQNDEIILMTGEDGLIDPVLLKKLNDCYTQSDIWILLGGDPFLEEALINHSIRDVVGISFRLKTFYAGLFKRVKLQDLLYGGSFLKSCLDQAFLFPMIEMAKLHAAFIPSLSKGSDRIDDSHLASWIRSLPPYPPLVQEPCAKEESKQMEAIIFSQSLPSHLSETLQSLETEAFGIDQMTVLYAEADESNLDRLQEAFPRVCFAKTPFSHPHFKTDLLENLFGEKSSSQYLFFLTDDLLIRKKCKLPFAASQLEKTCAHGFYFFFRSDPEMIDLEKDVFAWSFDAAKPAWGNPSPLEMALYRKDEIEKELKELHYDDPQSLSREWSSAFHRRGVGLCLR
jgi:hypothetical protein